MHERVKTCSIVQAKSKEKDKNGKKGVGEHGKVGRNACLTVERGAPVSTRGCMENSTFCNLPNDGYGIS